MLVLILFAVLAAPATAATRSSKKGLVIPNWPRHHCYDFQVICFAIFANILY